MRVWVFFAALGSMALAAPAPDYERALKFYNHTDYEESLQVLIPISDKTAPIWDLIGKNQFMRGEFKRATQMFEKALALDPRNSSYAHWLGKAHGRRAETANPLFAPSLASKARKNFEKAVALDPRNLEALSDLMEYYLEAPGFLGGGTDKAAKVAEQIASIDPVEGFNAKARLAEKRKEYSNAEAQLQRAVELAPKQVNRIIDLAKFLAQRGRFQEAEQAFQRAARIAPNAPQLLYAQAETYVRSHRNLETARELLHRYLQAPLTPDDPPREDAEKLLKEAGG